MSSPTPAAILDLENQTKNFIPQAAERPQSTFLSLAPATSDSYPKARLASEALARVPQTPETKRRTSSTSSDGNKSTGFRFLKLGPVHYGEHHGDNKTDWNEAVIE
jgi:hypothetical protein